jgi:hypothetical protein
MPPQGVKDTSSPGMTSPFTTPYPLPALRYEGRPAIPGIGIGSMFGKYASARIVQPTRRDILRPG